MPYSALWAWFAFFFFDSRVTVAFKAFCFTRAPFYLVSMDTIRDAERDAERDYFFGLFTGSASYACLKETRLVVS